MLAGGERMTSELFALAPRLRAIARTGVGYDLIDLAAATKHKVAVTITPGTNHESVAEQTMALLFALAKRVVHNDRVIHSGGWDRALVTPIRGKTLGLIGMGRIGLRSRCACARIWHGRRRFRHRRRCRIRQATRYQAARSSGAAGKLRRCQPPSTTHRCDARRWSIATSSRGCARALICLTPRAEVWSSRLTCATHCFQNISPAPAWTYSTMSRPSQGIALIGLANVVLSPHIAGTDTQSMRDMAELAATTIVELSQNRWPADCVVNLELREGWKW